MIFPPVPRRGGRGPRVPGAVRLAGIIRLPGIFGLRRSSVCMEVGGGIGFRAVCRGQAAYDSASRAADGEPESRDTGASGCLAVGSDKLMGTAERYGASGAGVATIAEAEREPRTPVHGIPADISTMDITAEAERVTEAGAAPGRAAEARPEAAAETGAGLLPGTEERSAPGAEGRGRYRPLWVEEPTHRRRLPDPVRTSAVRAVLIIAVTLIQAMIAFLCTMAGSWLVFPMVLSSVASTVVATWGALDVWVTRQVWNQRNGVVSEPSSTARALRRERRRARRQERTAERAGERIRRGGGAGQLSHSA